MENKNRRLYSFTLLFRGVVEISHQDVLSPSHLGTCIQHNILAAGDCYDLVLKFGLQNKKKKKFVEKKIINRQNFGEVTNLPYLPGLGIPWDTPERVPKDPSGGDSS